MIKLAFVSTSYITKYDGVSVYTENLLQEIINKINEVKKGIQIDVYVQESSYSLLKERIKFPDDIENFAKINFIPVSGKFFPLRLLNLTRYLYKNGKYDVVYMSNPMPIILAPGKKIKTIHDFSFKVAPEFYSLFAKIYSDFLRKISIKFDDALGYISETTKKDFEKFYGITEKEKNFIYLPNGIPFKVLKQKRPSLEEVESKFKNKNLKIVVVGRINRHKGFDRVLQFVKYADKKIEEDNYFSSIEINMVGKETSETKEILQNYKPSNIKLNFLGFLTDEELNKLYKESQFCFFLSRNEGYGLPLVESLWLRTIPILSDIPIFREIMGNEFPLFSDKTGYDKNIYSFIKDIFENKEYRKEILNHIDKVVEKEKKGYKIAAENLLKYIGYLDG